MKIRVPSTVMRDIGPLDNTVRLPMASRLSAGMSTVCDACGKQITDEFFIGGFKAGLKNLKLHEKCAGKPEPLVPCGPFHAACNCDEGGKK